MILFYLNNTQGHMSVKNNANTNNFEFKFSREDLDFKPTILRLKYKSMVEKYTSAMGFNETVTICKTNKFYSTAESHLSVETFKGTIKNAIALDASYFIDPKDVPSGFIIHSMDDERINDEAFINGFINWLSKYFELGALKPENITKKEKVDLILFLFKASNPDLMEKDRGFTLAREAAHLLCQHTEKNNYKHGLLFLSGLLKSALLAGVVGVGGNYLLPKKNSYLKGIGSALLGLGVGSAYAFSSLPSVTLSFYHQERQDELEADSIAVNTLKDKSGAIYHLTAHKEWSAKKALSESTASAFSPSKPEFDSHPSDDERIKNIEDMKL